MNDEARALGLESEIARGGVDCVGDWRDVWRANLWLRGASRVLLRVAEFRAMHLAQLDKRARKIDWAKTLAPNVPVKVEATSRRSKIYHSGASTERIENAIRDTVGAPISPDAQVRVVARIEDDLCTISVDTSGDPLYKRGYKLEVGKAPLRENLAAMFLYHCGYRGEESVVDPMCGSGTLVIEAAQIARHIAPGRARTFAFESLPSFDRDGWRALCDEADARTSEGGVYYGSDRDAGAVTMSRSNAKRAQVDGVTRFAKHAVSDLQPPPGPPGLVITNPPYGARIGATKDLRDLYATVGNVLK
ncbi:MAG: THUMP domain-containing protein, partial [Myxococcota bacterium]